MQPNYADYDTGHDLNEVTKWFHHIGGGYTLTYTYYIG